ncbi:MAG: iron-sulfur cluster assembly scaffold protein [Candidatus Sedimenticola endophacoides]
MYSELISENFSNPTHNGVLDKPDVMLKNVDPVCGDQVQVSLTVNDDGTILSAKFQAWGCATSIAASNLFCKWLEGKSLREVSMAKPALLSELLGDLAPEQRHCVEMLVRMVGQVKNNMPEFNS